MILAFDPGTVTGVASWDGLEISSTEVPGGLEGLVDEKFLTEYVGCVVAEDWQVRANTHKLSAQSDPYLCLGYLRGRCYELGIPFSVVSPARHKSFSGVGKANSKIAQLGWVSKADSHAGDALSVLLFALVQAKDPWVVEQLKGLL